MYLDLASTASCRWSKYTFIEDGRELSDSVRESWSESRRGVPNSAGNAVALRVGRLWDELSTESSASPLAGRAFRLSAHDLVPSECVFDNPGVDFGDLYGVCLLVGYKFEQKQRAQPEISQSRGITYIFEVDSD